MLPLFAWAEESLMTVDAQFDKTGDKIVDASDWKKMSDIEHLAYAKASLEALGMDPYTQVSSQKNRMQQYLDGLDSVYK